MDRFWKKIYYMRKLIKRIRLVSLLIVLIALNLTFFIACRKDSARKISPKAVNGVLDLKNWDLKKEGPVDLSGEWEFYWNKHLFPRDFSKSNPPEKTGLMSVPGCWNGYLLEGKQLSGDGYATYRLKVLSNTYLPTYLVPLCFRTSAIGGVPISGKLFAF